MNSFLRVCRIVIDVITINELCIATIAVLDSVETSIHPKSPRLGHPGTHTALNIAITALVTGINRR